MAKSNSKKKEFFLVRWFKRCVLGSRDELPLEEEDLTESAVRELIKKYPSLEEISDPSAIFNSPLFNNLKVFDTVSDLVLMTGLLVAVYFRVRTLKH